METAQEALPQTNADVFSAMAHEMGMDPRTGELLSPEADEGSRQEQQTPDDDYDDQSEAGQQELHDGQEETAQTGAEDSEDSDEFWEDEYGTIDLKDKAAPKGLARRLRALKDKQKNQLGEINELKQALLKALDSRQAPAQETPTPEAQQAPTPAPDMILEPDKYMEWANERMQTLEQKLEQTARYNQAALQKQQFAATLDQADREIVEYAGKGEQPQVAIQAVETAKLQAFQVLQADPRLTDQQRAQMRAEHWDQARYMVAREIAGNRDPHDPHDNPVAKYVNQLVKQGRFAPSALGPKPKQVNHEALKRNQARTQSAGSRGDGGSASGMTAARLMQMDNMELVEWKRSNPREFDRIMSGG